MRKDCDINLGPPETKFKNGPERGEETLEAGFGGREEIFSGQQESHGNGR